MIQILEIPQIEIKEYGDVFWFRWLSEQAAIRGSVYALCKAKSYNGDPEDLISDTAIRASEMWPGFNSRRGDFKTWVLWIARSLLLEQYRTSRLPIVGARQNADDRGEFIGAITGTSLLPLDDIQEVIGGGERPMDEVIIEMEFSLVVRAYVRRQSGLKGIVLRTMADLIDMDKRPSTRNISAMLGISHTTVAKIIRSIRSDLERMDITL